MKEPPDDGARAKALAKLLALALAEWRFAMEAHDIDCGSCRLDFEIYERQAAELGVEVKTTTTTAPW